MWLRAWGLLSLGVAGTPAAALIMSVWAGELEGWRLPVIGILTGALLIMAWGALLQGIWDLATSAAASRAVRRYPWRPATAWFYASHQVHATFPVAPVQRTEVTVLRAVTPAGEELLLRVNPLNSRRALAAVKGTEVWLALGPRRRGVGSLPPGAALFLVKPARTDEEHALARRQDPDAEPPAAHSRG